MSDSLARVLIALISWTIVVAVISYALGYIKGRTEP